jgi:hypothetical protein
MNPADGATMILRFSGLHGAMRMIDGVTPMKVIYSLSIYLFIYCNKHVCRLKMRVIIVFD